MSTRAERRRQLREQEKSGKLGNQMRIETGTAIANEELKSLTNAAVKHMTMLDMIDDKQRRFREGYEARQRVRERIAESQELTKEINEIREKAYQEGLKAGHTAAGWQIVKCAMAAGALMMKEAFGIEDQDEIARGLGVLHDKMAWAMSYSDMVDEVLAETGLELCLDDPLDPIRTVEP